MKTFNLFIILTLLPVLALAKTDYSYKGSLGFEQWSFPRKGHDPQNDANDTFEFKGEGTIEFGDSWQILAAPRLKADVVEDSRNRITADEAWIQYASDKFEIRIGVQTFFWGTVESENIVDILNQRDYEDDFFDPDKLGEFAARFSYFGDDFTFELYYLPYFRPATFPSRYSRYSLIDGATDSSFDEEFRDGTQWDPQGAFRASTTIGSADMALSFFHGWARFPVLNVEPEEPDVIPYYYKEDTLSYDIQMALGAWLFKGEAVYKNTDINDDFMRMSIEPGGKIVSRNLIPDSYLAYVVGGEYTFEQVIATHDLALLIEYLGDTDQGEITPDYRAFQNDLFFGFRYSFNDANDKKLEAGGTLALEKGDELFYSVEYSQRFWEDFNFILEYRDVAVESSESPLAVFREDGRISTQIIWNF
jgi:hypothetical protein